MKIGAQLYTVRNACKTPEDFALTLRRVADMGYSVVQVSGSCPYEAEWLKEQLDRNGLTCAITHFNKDKILGEPEETVRFHNVFGCRHIGLGSIPGGVEALRDLDRSMEALLVAGKRISACGAYMMYHNHQIEFGKYSEHMTYLERLAEYIPAEYMGFTLDTYWVQVGGGNPAQWLTRLKGRVPCIHLKDLAIEGHEQRFAAIGAGNIDFEPILAAAESAGTQYLLIEQDDCYDKDPFDELHSSYRYLHALGLE